MSFASYKEYLQYTYNSAHASGRIVELIELVKNQPKHIPFDYEFNTVEGKEEKGNVSSVFPLSGIDNSIVFFFVGAILFGIHGDDLSAEITNLLTELNSSKMALWKQMCVVEIVAAEIAENLGKDGTWFEMEPDRVI